ncbi:DUF2975 domain-containing protein [Exiguobacterium sp. s191]|uniref:DUF2975 domain-containing protein n=1 Tax=Exiguobacterium sp. s191 TaxID=2751196 RepID=UPI001BEA5CDD
MNHFVWQIRFLRFIVFGIIFSLFGLAGLGIPLVWHGITKNLLLERPGYSVLLTAYLIFIPTLLILFHALRILRYMSMTPPAFPLITASIQSMKLCFYIVTILTTCLFPVFFYIGQIDDAPGLIVIGMGLILTPLTFGITLSCIQHLLLRNVLPLES